MYCDCVLARAGWSSGYIVVYVISALFMTIGVAIMLGGWRTSSYASLESIKDQVLDEDV